ncbi:MAG: glycosyltransferase [Pseudomonadales bacterium]|jgi:glycosyltransferase involved in cell wall biosynthesis|nr:glycosyltransferase [Pseudomonadales bacterium]
MVVEFLRASARIKQFYPSQTITNFMHIIWLSRPDLQAVFDISNADGQAAFLRWVGENVKREYGIAPTLDFSNKNHKGLLNRLASLFFGKDGVRNKEAQPGATLIGYTEGVLGMGEHVRMSAETLARTTTNFGTLNIDVGPHQQCADIAAHFPMITDNRYRANIFHVNADQMLNMFCKLGPNFFHDRYNIGFWAWELAKFPDAWLPVIEMVDEIWAPSRFIQDALSAVTDKPVVHMPLCVELPTIQARSRRHFGLPDEHCLFLYTFDFLSYIDRKNPFAAIRAFKEAFPDRNAPAGLVLKVMRGDSDAPKWHEMLELIGGDSRIVIINEVMSRNDVLALLECCDCFVSLHRSEGFGRGPAEAMYLGKPVIVTNYSGNLDFTRPDASLLVEQTLIPVEPGQYVFGAGQVWADVDVSHAARHMRKVFEKSPDVAEIARNGERVIKEEFSYPAIAQHMNNRLRAVGAI